MLLLLLFLVNALAELFSLLLLKEIVRSVLKQFLVTTVELQWLEHLLDHENMLETRVLRANECKS